MRIAGIICEYNPLHLGHQKQLDYLKQENTAVVCLMSGNFVQRGQPAIFDKMVRAEAAIRCGADLVLELPVTAALSSAEGFAAKGVQIAFENQRKLANIAWTFEEIEDAPNVGFCWDTGHENCFTPGRQYMPLFGKKLICTHIHDNNGVFDHDEHLLPFDGKLDFVRAARQIRESGFTGALVLEVEPPESSEIAARRVAFYEKWGFCVNERPYAQPSFHGEDPVFAPLPVFRLKGRFGSSCPRVA